MAKIVVAQEAIYRSTPNTGGAPDWNNYQVRMKNSFALSPRLLAYRQCIAGLMKGTEWNNLGEVQTAFAVAAHRCAEQVKNMPHYGKIGRSKVIVFGKGAVKELTGKAEQRILASEEKKKKGKTPRDQRFSAQAEKANNVFNSKVGAK